ncbi:hypothetical protein [Arthrobacter sp. AQ5-05]|uniref:hypothetical protein n=1 Tax=Arthrobacter sp. AQ5-05 TaxID=2184581 RepID=UPI0012B5994D|nr:hypothetical protein [Arthrobacter sp. AQ5-05]
MERVKKITYQVKKSLVVVDSDNFLWRQNVDRERWLLYRSCSENDRKLDQISPVELANAAVDIVTRKGGMTADALGRMILARFGRSRMSKLTKTHLAQGFEQAKAFGRITEVDGDVKLAAGPLDAGLATV